MRCIETLRMSTVWNGKNLNWFKPTIGIRKGDAISPYLFVLCVERLRHLINHAVTKGRWKPIKLSKYGPPISHMFFVDDLLLFAEATTYQIEVIMDSLDKLCDFSRQRESRPKSSITFSNGIDANVATRISNMSKIPVTNSLERHLGILSIMGRVKFGQFKHILDCMERWLIGWKAKNLILVGRVVLAKSVLASTPIVTSRNIP